MWFQLFCRISFRSKVTKVWKKLEWSMILRLLVLVLTVEKWIAYAADRCHTQSLSSLAVTLTSKNLFAHICNRRKLWNHRSGNKNLTSIFFFFFLSPLSHSHAPIQSFFYVSSLSYRSKTTKRYASVKINRRRASFWSGPPLQNTLLSTLGQGRTWVETSADKQRFFMKMFFFNFFIYSTAERYWSQLSLKTAKVQ